jgi:hypothetical protein
VLLYTGSLFALALVVLSFVPDGMVNVVGTQFAPRQLSVILGTCLGAVRCDFKRIHRARSTVEHERDCVDAERDAFIDFADTVEAMEVSKPLMSETPPLVETTAHEAQLQTIQDTYRATIMAVPDFDEEYGETLPEHLAAEFGEDVAEAVVAGKHFGDPLKQTLVSKARAEAEKRENFLEGLRTELTSIKDALSRLQDTTDTIDKITEPELLQTSFTALYELDRELRLKHHHCEQLLADRQRDIHQANLQGSLSDESFFLQKYLYQDHDATFPILTTTLELVQHLRDNQSAVTRSISRRD